jgi:hypothetical protein
MAGYDAVHVREYDLHTADDTAVLDRANEESGGVVFADAPTTRIRNLGMRAGV